MTRWKREFRAWCKREGMAMYAIPKSPKDWAVAKALTKLIDHQVRDSDFEHAYQTAMIYGSATLIGHPKN